MKICPFCSEQIQDEARKCKHCGEWLSSPALAVAENPRPPMLPPVAVDQAQTTLGPDDVAVEPTGLRRVLRFLLAWLIAAYILVSIQLRWLIREDVSSSQAMLSGILLATNAALAIYLVRAFRGPNKDWKNYAESAPKLSVWGFAWRAVVANFGGTAVMFTVSRAFSIDFTQAEPTVTVLLAWQITLSLSMAVAAWAFFSRDHRGQLQVLVRSLRGY